MNRFFFCKTNGGGRGFRPPLPDIRGLLRGGAAASREPGASAQQNRTYRCRLLSGDCAYRGRGQPKVCRLPGKYRPRQLVPKRPDFPPDWISGQLNDSRFSIKKFEKRESFCPESLANTGFSCFQWKIKPSGWPLSLNALRKVVVTRFVPRFLDI